LEPVHAAAFAGAGLVAGALNTFAGGGSVLTVPALMLLGGGMPADAANATSRVSVLAQCLAGSATFARGGVVPTESIPRVVPPTLLGAIGGAWLATWLPAHIFKPLLLGTLVVMALALLIDPTRFAPAPGAEPRRAPGPLAMGLLFVAGVYGGVLQAGAGLVLLAIFSGGLRFDLVRANALKALVMLVYIAATVVVFASADLVRWVPAAAMSAGSLVGAWVAARVAMSARGILITKLAVIGAVIAMGVTIALR
jgi:uncharacterized membrane protein YfcA